MGLKYIVHLGATVYSVISFVLLFIFLLLFIILTLYVRPPLHIRKVECITYLLKNLEAYINDFV